MESIATFYQMLFTAEIAIFGILAAALFVFVQLVYGHFSYRHISVVLKNLSLSVYAILSTVTLIATGVASFSLSFQHHNLFPQYNFALQITFANELVAIILLSSFFLSLALFASYAFFSIWYLRPHKMAELLRKKVKTKTLRAYLLKQYGMPSPEFTTIRTLYSLPNREGRGNNNPKESRDLEKEKLIYDKLKVQVRTAKDPLEVLNALILRSINEADVTSLGEIRHVIRDIAKDFFKTYKKAKTDQKEAWSPDDGISGKFLEHLIDLLRTYVEMSNRQNLESAHVIFLEMSNDILKEILLYNEAHEMQIILNFWKDTGDAAINQSPRVFSKVISLYRALADVAFDNGIEGRERWLEDVFRHLGWLGERLFSKKQLEEKPIIWDTSYSNEFDDLINTVWSYDHKYSWSYPNAYPLIYFDLIYVIFLKLVEEYKQRRLSNIKNLLFDCTYTYSSFAIEAIKKGNSNGAALAAMRMKENYEHLMENNLQDIVSDIIGLFINVAAHAASHANQLSSVEFLREPIDTYLTNVIVNSVFRSEIQKEMMDVYIKVPGDRDLKWKFITNLGVRMGTNFGFQFDPATGETYSTDDPRRI